MPRDARPEEKRRRRQRDGYRVLPDGEHEYKGDAYYGYDEMTSQQRSARGHLHEDEDLDYDLTNEYEQEENRRKGRRETPATKAQKPDQSTQEP